MLNGLLGLAMNDRHEREHYGNRTEGEALDAAVATRLGWRKVNWSEGGGDWDWRGLPTKGDERGELKGGKNWRPSLVWDHGGPIIEAAHIYIGYCGIEGKEWEAIAFATYGYEGPEGPDLAYGPTPLVAAMRAYVCDSGGPNGQK